MAPEKSSQVFELEQSPFSQSNRGNARYKGGHGSGAREGSALRLGDGGERGFDDVEAFVELLVGDDKRDEDANHVLQRAGGDGDEAVLVAITRDLLGFRVGGLAGGSVAHKFHRAHAA